MGEDRDDVAKLIYDTWVKAKDGPHWLDFKELPYVAGDDYTAICAVTDAIMGGLNARRIAGLKEAAELIEARHKAHVARNSVAYELESEACASLIRARISSLSPVPRTEEGK